MDDLLELDPPKGSSSSTINTAGSEAEWDMLGRALGDSTSAYGARYSNPLTPYNDGEDGMGISLEKDDDL